MAEQEGVAQVEAAEVREEAQEATQPTQQEAQEALLHHCRRAGICDTQIVTRG